MGRIRTNTVHQSRFIISYSLCILFSLSGIATCHCGNAVAQTLEAQGKLSATLLTSTNKKELLLDSSDIRFRLSFADKYEYIRPKKLSNTLKLGHYYKIRGNTYLPDVINSIGEIKNIFIKVTYLEYLGEDNTHETGTLYSKVNVSKKIINIKLPDGYVDAMNIDSDIENIGELFTPDTNRLLAIIVKKEDINSSVDSANDLDSYMVIQTVKDYENSNISQKQFKKNISDIIRDNHQNIIKESDGALGRKIKTIEEKLSKELDLKTNLEIGKPKSMGVIYEKPNALGVAMLTRHVLTTKLGKVDYIMAGGLNVLLIKGKLINAYVYKVYENENSLEWVKSTSKRWVTTLLESNQDN